MRLRRLAVTVAALAFAFCAPLPLAVADGGSEPYVTKPCPGDEQYYPDEDPTRFWECSNGTAYQFTCPWGYVDGEKVRLRWDVNLLTCNWPDRAGAVEPTS
ncbi:carbohydrate-binding module family 14 protein [Streptomyces sp. NBC_01351]|uniref:carbohydrate-binding module family 14 protein n=1 Tax=Streptomyces sp. NBC_01351 TaxID=2903833 RepID=UPI002E377BEF|nr:carbohydrate-binding module family 14 protein [Streptomyces sp. NBC_01351]